MCYPPDRPTDDCACLFMSEPNLPPGLPAALNPCDPCAWLAQTFPTLPDDAFDRVEHLSAGTVLFARGERAVDFFLVLEGAVEIYEHRRGEVRFNDEVLPVGRKNLAVQDRRFRRHPPGLAMN